MPNDSAPIEQLTARVQALEAELTQVKAAAATRGFLGQLEEVLDLAPTPIFLKSPDLTYLFVNREFARLAGSTRAQIVGRTDFDVFPEPVARLFRAQDEEVLGKRTPCEFREALPLVDGPHSYITSKFLLRSDGGALTALAGICTEITALERAQRELEAAQAELVRQERLAALGELSAVVAHEVRNPIAVIFNSLAALKRHGQPHPECETLLGIIREEADRLNRMVGALLELGRPNEAVLVPSQVEAVLASAIEGARAVADPSAEVTVDIPRPLPTAMLDENMLRQALMNLIANAIQAPARRSAVRVRLTTEAEMLRFEVADDGSGVPAELRERIFTPFFTTRAKGTGLGLSVVRRIADAHQGQVTVGSGSGAGATFVLCVPIDGPRPSGPRRQPSLSADAVPGPT